MVSMLDRNRERERENVSFLCWDMRDEGDGGMVRAGRLGFHVWTQPMNVAGSGPTGRA